MPARPRACEILATWLNEPGAGRSQSWLARTLGVTQPSVSSWCRGANVPEPKFRRALSILLGVDQSGRARLPEDAWLTEVERAQLKRLESVAREAAKTGTG